MRHLGMAIERGRHVLQVAAALLVASVIVAGAAHAASGRLSFVPRVDFGNQLVNTKSATLTIVITNTGDAAVKIAKADLTNDLDFNGHCPCLGVTLAPGESLAGTITFTPRAIGTLSGRIVINSDGGPQIIELVGVGYAAGAPPATDSAIEYYRAEVDHYFITWVVAEIGNLDSGATRGWTRTGQSFKVYTAAQGGTSAVCRIYIPPGKGDGHFFGRDAGECNGTIDKNPTFFLESPSFFFLTKPDLGNCAAGMVPVYRVFSNRADANHRYTTDRATRDLMVTRDWLAEGDGPDSVVMCAPE